MAMVITYAGVESVRKVIGTWTGAADGTASATTEGDYHGKIVGLTTIPGAGGDAPTDNYDLVVTDEQGHDVLLGAGANRDTANTEHVASASLASVASSRLTISITNSGNAKKGTVILWIG